MNCYMFCTETDKYVRIYGYSIQIDNTIEPHVFKIREEDKIMQHPYLDNDSVDAYRFMVEGIRGAGKSNKVITPLPTKYIINDGAVILFWSDGDKTIVKKAKDDNNDPVKGFLWAYFIKHSKLSKTKANKYLKDLVVED